MQISATASRVVVVEHEVRLRGLGPLGEETNRGDLPECVELLLPARRHRERRHRPHDLAGDAERLAAGGQHVHVRAPPQHQLDELTGGVEDVLAVVEHQQEVLRREQLGDGVGEGSVGPLLHVEGVGDGGGDRALVAHRGQLDETDTVRVGGRDRGGQPMGQAGLAHPSGPEQGEDPAGVEEPQGQLEVAFPADQRGGLGRDAPAARGGRCRPGAAAGRGGGTHASSSRSSRIAVSSSLNSCDGSSPRSSPSTLRNWWAARNASACRPER